MMEETAAIKNKKEKYRSLLIQISSLLENEADLIANLSNIVAALKYGMDFFWVGFYFVKESGLVLGPFQGPVACTRIPFNKGVCGACYSQKETIIVPDVNKFSGHIACSSETRSEIVVPVFKNEEVTLILDIDSDKLDDFGEVDKYYLVQLGVIIEKNINL
ncbi:MAG: GAF domain-containing protein [Cytophagales bacterium]|nr:GAF domain-containing protein [Cytophagales bacterium]